MGKIRTEGVGEVQEFVDIVSNSRFSTVRTGLISLVFDDSAIMP